jgi:transposase
MIHAWKKALLEGASGMFERGRKKVPKNDEKQMKELHAKIGERAGGNDFLSRKLKPWGLK